LAAWLVGWMNSSLFGWLLGFPSVCWSDSCLLGWLVGCLLGWLVGWLFG